MIRRTSPSPRDTQCFSASSGRREAGGASSPAAVSGARLQAREPRRPVRRTRWRTESAREALDESRGFAERRGPTGKTRAGRSRGLAMRRSPPPVPRPTRRRSLRIGSGPMQARPRPRHRAEPVCSSAARRLPKALTNRGPVPAGRLAAERAPSPTFNLLRPCGFRVRVSGAVNAGEELGGHLGALFFGKAERLVEDFPCSCSHRGRIGCCPARCHLQPGKCFSRST